MVTRIYSGLCVLTSDSRPHVAAAVAHGAEVLLAPPPSLLWPPQTAGCAASHPTLLRLLVLTSCLKWLLQSHTRLISEDTVLILILVFYFSLIVMGDVNNVIYPSWDTNNRPKKLSSLLQ